MGESKADDGGTTELRGPCVSRTESEETSGSLTVDDLINTGLRPSVKTLVTLILALANAADAVEVLAVGFMLTVYREANGSELTSWQKEVLTGSIYMGMLIGGVVGGWLSDIVGRKRTLTWSLALNATAGLLSAAAPNFEWLSFMRVLAGIGIGSSVPCLFTLGAELLPVATRGLHLSYIASFWMVGSLYAAVAAWVILGEDANGRRLLPGWTWRPFVGVAAAPVFITLALVAVYMPESPRFLIQRGQYQAAAEMLNRLTGAMVTAGTLQAVEGAGISTETQTHGTHGLRRVTVLFSSSLRATTLRLIVIWFTLCFGTYGLNTWISTIFTNIGIKNEFLPTFLFALANLPGNVASFFLIERMGRKRLLAYSMLLAAISAFVFALTSRKAQWAAVGASCAFQAFSVSGWNSLDALSTESFPTAVRTTGMGLLSGTGRLASLIAMLVNGTLEGSVMLLFTVTGMFTILGAFTSFLLPYEPTAMSLDGLGVESKYKELLPAV